MIFRTKPKQQDPWSQWGGRRARHVPYTVLDCEMTGLNPKKDQIVAIGACKIHQGQLDLGQTFYQVIKTDVPLSRENILIHRLTHSQIASGRPVQEVLQELIAFIADDLIVGHFIRIDLKFLVTAAKSSGLVWPKNPSIDTMRLAQWKFHRENPHANHPSSHFALSRLCERWHVPHFEAHHAFYDALTTAHLYLKFLAMQEQSGSLSLADLLKKANRDPQTNPGG